MDLIIKDVVLYDGNRTNVGIRAGKISEISSEIVDDGRKVVYANGLFLLPGAIDPHVHCRDLGHAYKEDWKTVSMAAAAGGVTSIFDMPNTNPATIDESSLLAKREVAASKSIVNFGFHLGATVDNSLWVKGKKPLGVKIYMGATTGDLLVEDEAALESHFSNDASVVIIHAEDNTRMKENSDRLRYRSDPIVHTEIRDNCCAHICVDRAMKMQEKFGTKLLIAHASTKKEVETVRAAKNAGRTVYMEVTPHHLFFSKRDMLKQGNFLRMNPPLRSSEDVEELWRGLVDGTIDMIATDHAPHTIEEKSSSYWDAPSGVPGLDTMMPLMLNLVNEGKISMKRLVELTSKRAAEIFGLNKGEIAVGKDADLILVDLGFEHELRNDSVYSKCRWTPFDRFKVKGKVVTTIVNGNIVYDRGEFNFNKLGDEIVGISVADAAQGIISDYISNEDLGSSDTNVNEVSVSANSEVKVEVYNMENESRVRDLGGVNSLRIKNVVISPPIMNASGPLCTSFEELEALCRSSAGAVVIKSTTYLPRTGNPHPKYFEFAGNSINSNGLENPGYLAYVQMIPKLREKYPEKVFVSSIVGFNRSEFVEMVTALAPVVDMLEINLSCPNIPGKPQVAYDMESSLDILLTLRRLTDKPMGVKLPAYLDSVFQKQMAEVLVKGGVDFISLINSLGHTIFIDGEETCIHPNNGRGGLGGEFIKPVALGQVNAFYSLIGDKIPIFGVGGISSGKDVYDYVLAGASAVQVGTAYAMSGTAVFDKIGSELSEIFVSKGSSWNEKLGKLKVRDKNGFLGDRDVAKMLLEIKAVTLSPHSPYSYKSGLKGPIYCDNRLIMSYPNTWKNIIEKFVEYIKLENIEFDVIAGTATAGIPHAAYLSGLLGKPMIYVRSSGKGYGRNKKVEGYFEAGQKVLVIEDVITTGGSSLDVVETLRAVGANVVCCMSIYTHGFKASVEAFANAQCKIFTLTNFNTLLDVALQNNYVSSQDKDILLEWNKDPQNWSAKRGM